ncbi:hypothetical protein BB559_004325 [Furculomyces boomerangus]|uniref:Uncharacterized protein n=1 Tax=Furculomyces boomerangus TaxID=61424 RepID=A0A2T9YFD2_9FUNG|nr:hypothetical protein BB559_004325 [Furculomyces boomerangus]
MELTSNHCDEPLFKTLVKLHLPVLVSTCVGISKIYQLGLSKITKSKYSEEEIEFRRRLFWSFYAFDRGGMRFSGSLPAIEDKDIVVNIPENDFCQRYGGNCEVEHLGLFFGVTSLTAEFSKRRWIKIAYNPDGDNCQLVKLIDKLDKYEKTTASNPPIDLDLIKEAFPEYKDTNRFTMDIEHIL